MKKYLLITFSENGENYRQSYKLSEVHFISKLAQQFPSVTLNVKLTECSVRQYNSIFGIGDPFGDRDV